MSAALLSAVRRRRFTPGEQIMGRLGGADSPLCSFDGSSKAGCAEPQQSRARWVAETLRREGVSLRSITGPASRSSGMPKRIPCGFPSPNPTCPEGQPSRASPLSLVGRVTLKWRPDLPAERLETNFTRREFRCEIPAHRKATGRNRCATPSASDLCAAASLRLSDPWLR